MKTNLHSNEIDVILHKGLKLGWIFDTERENLCFFFSISHYVNLIVWVFRSLFPMRTYQKTSEVCLGAPQKIVELVFDRDCIESVETQTLS